MLERAFAACDGSDEAATAAELLMRLVPAGGQVTLASVVEEPLAFPETTFEASGHEWLVERAVADREEELAELARRAPAGVGTEIAVSSAVRVSETLLAMFDVHGADGLAVGRRGVGGLRRALLGSRSQQLLEHAQCPVLLVHEMPDLTGEPLVIAGVDGSDATPAVVAHAAQAARQLGGRLLLVSVVASPTARATLDATSSLREFAYEQAERLFDSVIEAAGLDRSTLETLVLEGDAGPVLTDLAEERQPALVVVGDRGRQGFKGLLLGSAARKLVVETERPVLVVKSR